MSKFILLDHSVKGVGGHHFEYAQHVLRSAERLGYEIVIGANRRLEDYSHGWPKTWRVFTPYRFSTYCKHSFVGNLSKWCPVDLPQAACQQSAASENRIAGQLQRAGRWLAELRRIYRGRVRSVSFARATARVFREVELLPGDQVFVPTVNEFDFAGLVRYLKQDPKSRLADWHVQFHFNIEPDWPTDLTARDYHLGRMRTMLRDCRAELPGHRISFYTTTEGLASQFSRLGEVVFRGMPYPVDAALSANHHRTRRAGPLRITCLGGVRDEKGLDALPQILTELWADYFDSGRIQLQLQAESTRELPEKVRRLVAESPIATAGKEKSPIVAVPHPMSTEGYRDLIMDSDVGLLAYRRDQYLDRCSGVLVEMLAAGVPVIVPAGCWLADQLAPAIADHHRSIASRLRPLGVREPSQLTLATRPLVLEGPSTQNDPLRFAASRAVVAPGLDVPAGATHALVAVEWSGASFAARYALIEVRPFDGEQRALPTHLAVVPRPVCGEHSTVLLPLPPQTGYIQVLCRNAYHDEPLRISGVRVDYFMAANELNQSCPLGAVGLIAARPTQVPALLRELIEHHAHYRQTAAEFSKGWARWHNADQVVAELLKYKRSTSAESGWPRAEASRAA